MISMPTDPHIEVSILSRPQYLCVVRAAAREALTQLGLYDAEIIKVITAVDEAVTNVIRHGYGDREDGPIRVRLWPVEQAGRTGVQIVIEDETHGVDLSKIEGRPLDEIRPGGLGVHIIRQVMDEVEYTNRPDHKGVCLKMRKYNQPAAPAQTG